MKGIKNLATAFFIILLWAAALAPENRPWCRLYFTGPGQSAGGLPQQNPQEGLVRLIREARRSFSGAFYEISSAPVIDELLAAKKRGVRVRIVTEEDNACGPGINRLMAAGVPVVTDGRKGLMHHKFAVVDGEQVWTGSYNITDSGARRNDNNAILIRSPELASLFLEEFREMFVARVFGNRKERGPFSRFRKKYTVKVEGREVGAYFSPEDDIERIITKRVLEARESVHFMAFSFTSDVLGEAMIRKFRDGVAVLGLFEKNGSDSRYSEYLKMKLEGLSVRLDRNRHAMHHKVIVIDRRVVITGSYNFSENARKRNDENVLILEDRDLAARYLEEFYRLY